MQLVFSELQIVFCKDSYNPISHHLSSSITWPCHSAIKGWSPTHLRWMWAGLPWGECIRGNAVSIMKLGQKTHEVLTWFPWNTQPWRVASQAKRTSLGRPHDPATPSLWEIPCKAPATWRHARLAEYHSWTQSNCLKQSITGALLKSPAYRMHEF